MPFPTRATSRNALKGLGAAGVAAAFATPALAVPKTVKIGVAAPSTGPLAIFSEQVPWVVEQIMKVTGGQVDVGGTKHPLRFCAPPVSSPRRRSLALSGSWSLSRNCWSPRLRPSASPIGRSTSSSSPSSVASAASKDRSSDRSYFSFCANTWQVSARDI